MREGREKEKREDKVQKNNKYNTQKNNKYNIQKYNLYNIDILLKTSFKLKYSLIKGWHNGRMVCWMVCLMVLVKTLADFQRLTRTG